MFSLRRQTLAFASSLSLWIVTEQCSSKSMTDSNILAKRTRIEAGTSPGKQMLTQMPQEQLGYIRLTYVRHSVTCASGNRHINSRERLMFLQEPAIC